MRLGNKLNNAFNILFITFVRVFLFSYFNFMEVTGTDEAVDEK